MLDYLKSFPFLYNQVLCKNHPFFKSPILPDESWFIPKRMSSCSTSLKNLHTIMIK